MTRDRWRKGVEGERWEERGGRKGGGGEGGRREGRIGMDERGGKRLVGEKG